LGEAVEAIRAASPIEEVVAERVKLRRSGVQLRGLCPFHSEHTPSFYVHPAKARFYCHGCQAGGDVFTFTMKILNCRFLEAVKVLAHRAGIAIEGFAPSPELLEMVREQRAQRERERRFEEFANRHIQSVADTYRRLGHAATHAEQFLRSRLAEIDPYLHEQAWDAIARYIEFGLRIEREGLLDLNVLRTAWNGKYDQAA